MENKRIFWLLAILIAAFGVMILIRPAHAQTPNPIYIWKGLDQLKCVRGPNAGNPCSIANANSDECGGQGYACGSCLQTGDCNLGSGETFFLNLIDLILKFLGVAALVGFIYGGITWITSGGSPDKVKRGKDALIGSVVGIVIVLFAYVIIYTIINVVAKPEYNYLSPGGGGGSGCQATDKYKTECPNLTAGGAEVWSGGDPSCHSDQVSNLQEKLVRYKCLADTPGADSCFGGGTQKAVIDFIAKNPSCPNCKTDGTVDWNTYNFIITPTFQQLPCAP